MTHNEIASTIRNKVADGLSGNITNQAFSIEQLMDEIDLVRAELAHKYSTNFKLDKKYLIQELNNVKVECKNLSSDCFIDEPGADVPSILIPRIMATFQDQAIEYLGLNNMQESFAVYFHPEDIRNHKVRIRTKKRPFAWVDLANNSQDMMRIFFFNFGLYNPLKFIKVRAIFEHPTSLHISDPNAADNEYPAPAYMQKMIIDELVEKYIRYFRQLTIPEVPNTQSDTVT